MIQVVIPKRAMKPTKIQTVSFRRIRASRDIPQTRVALQTKTFTGMNTPKTKMPRRATNVSAQTQEEPIDMATNSIRIETDSTTRMKGRRLLRLPTRRQVYELDSWIG